jgi:hypothetical protein
MVKKKAPIFKFILFVVFVIASSTVVKATHIRAGDIKVVRISNITYTYRITLNLYTTDASQIDQSTATITLGDGKTRTVGRKSLLSVGGGTSLNVFEVEEYTYNAVGFYKIGFQEQNRNAGIINMANSVYTAFYVETAFSIDPFLGANSSAILTVPPIDQGAIGRIYAHNPGAYDSDGDSLAYKFVTPQSNKGINVLDYRLPGDPYFGGTSTTGGSTYMTIDPVSGNIEWNAPSSFGFDPRYYNIAIMVEEWRQGVRIGYVIRDMQIEILSSTNRPPVIKKPNDTCVVAGALIQHLITATDPDNNALFMESYSNTYTLSSSPATFSVVSNNSLNPIGSFRWQTNCSHVREQPYQVVYKVTDRSLVIPILSDIKTTLIYVKAPKPTNLTVTPLVSSMQLNWSAYTCGADKIKIYRKECAAASISPSPCDAGVPDNSGYTFIGEVSSTSTSYTDNQNLKQGVVYCYILIATFPQPKGGQSYASDEVCTRLAINEAVQAYATVVTTGTTNGQVNIKWFNPIDNPVSSPYAYEVWRASSDNSSAYTQIGIVNDDTVFTDNGLNTLDKQYFYKVRLVGASAFSVVQSTVNLKVQPRNSAMVLTWTQENIQQIDTVEVYRKINSGSFSKIQTFTNKLKNDSYTDQGLKNCDTVCYYILLKGSFCVPKLEGQLYSQSQEKCGVPKDDSPPIAPTLTLISCAQQEGLTSNLLSWNSLSDPKCDNINSYRVYYAFYPNTDFQMLMDAKVLNFAHPMIDSSLAGCYQIAAVNYLGIEGARSEPYCVDNCTYYKVPNLITRNNDKLNDLFRAFPIPKGVKSVRLRMYNSWGAEIYSFEGDPNINWNTVTNSGKVISEGVYYYSIDINYYRRLNPDDEMQTINGWLHVLGDSEPKQKQ